MIKGATVQAVYALNKYPSLFSLYASALLKRKSRKSAMAFSDLPIYTINSKIHLRQLNRYKQLCEIKTIPAEVPVFYPQVLAFRLHLFLLLNRKLPFPVMGLVHKSNDVQYLKAIQSNDTLKIEVGLKQLDCEDKGISCHIYTHVYVADELRWQAISTYYYRKPNQSAVQSSQLHSTKPHITTKPDNISHSSNWSLPNNLGRQYALITGDLNPIHLFTLLAKLFGFKRTIIHGMYLAARAVAETISNPIHYPLHVSVQFKRPVFIPNEVSLNFSKQAFYICPILQQVDQNNTMILGQINYPHSTSDASTVKVQTLGA